MENRKLTQHFNLYEFIEAHPTGSEEFKRIAWKNIKDFKPEKAQQLAEFLERKREYINKEYKHENDNKEIGIKITSAFRPLEWELLQKRSGKSRHTQSDAVDIQPICNQGLATKILKHLHSIDWPLDTGHKGGFAIKEPTKDRLGKILQIGFIHYDFDAPRRWFY